MSDPFAQTHKGTRKHNAGAIKVPRIAANRNPAGGVLAYAGKKCAVRNGNNEAGHRGERFYPDTVKTDFPGAGIRAGRTGFASAPDFSNWPRQSRRRKFQGCGGRGFIKDAIFLWRKAPARCRVDRQP